MYQIYMYKEDLALNNLPGLICHKIQPTFTNGLNIDLLLQEPKRQSMKWKHTDSHVKKSFGHSSG